jgi:hypothetical protein
VRLGSKGKSQKAPGEFQARLFMVFDDEIRTSVLSVGDVLKRTVLPTLILMASPVRGLTPLRALVLCIVKVPKLGKVNLLLFFVL